MKQKQIKTNKSLQTAVWFFLLVTVFLILGIIVRTSILFLHMHFDRVHAFTLLVTKNAQYAEVIAVMPNKNSLSLAKVHTTVGHENVGKELAIPIDAAISDPMLTQQEQVTTILGRLVKHFAEENPQKMNILDAIFLYFQSRRVQLSNIQTVDISLPYIGSDISSFFVDDAIYKENMTISIVNASNVSGRGGNLAKLFTDMGGHVISVTTANSTQPHSSIASDNQKSYTVNKIISLLPLQQTPLPSNAVSDIIITIGEDQGYSTVY